MLEANFKIFEEDNSLVEVYDLKHIRARIEAGGYRPYKWKAETADFNCRQRAIKIEEMTGVSVEVDDISLILEEMFEEAAIKGCHYCGEPFLNAFEMTVDHKIPMRRGGPHIARNVVISCEPCNKLRDSIGDELALLDPAVTPFNPIAELRYVAQPI